MHDWEEKQEREREREREKEKEKDWEKAAWPNSEMQLSVVNYDHFSPGPPTNELLPLLKLHQFLYVNVLLNNFLYLSTFLYPFQSY